MPHALPITGQAEARRLKIGDLAQLAGKSTRAVRLYEEMGLLGPVVRTEGGHRVYDNQAVIRLTWIEKLQLLGFSLPKIGELLDELEDAERGPAAMDKIRSIFREKLDETNAQLRALENLSEELEDSLRYLETCSACDPNTLLNACPKCAQPHQVEAPTLIAGIHSGPRK